MSKKDQGGKNKKYGRNKNWCLVYRTRMIRDKNRVRTLKRHLKNFPNDLKANIALG
jgi:hypothetical protein